MTLAPVRKTKLTFTPEQEAALTGDEAADESVISAPAIDKVESAAVAPKTDAAGHHPWIAYLGTDKVLGPDEAELSGETALVVVTKVTHDKLNPIGLTTAEMVARRDDADYPILYRVA